MKAGEVLRKFCGEIRKIGDYITFDDDEKVKVKGDDTLDLSDDKDLQLTLTPDGIPHARTGNVEIVRCGPIVTPSTEAGQKTENEKLLDNLGHIFTRTDLLEPQSALLNLESQHKVFIGTLRPALSAYRPHDMAALVTAATVIRFENQLLSEQRASYLHDRLKSTYGRRGCMIYNLFRSGILQHEVIPYWHRTRKDHREKPDEARVQFLDYWDSILIKGYPSAYFVRREDKKSDFFCEIKWRTECGELSIRIFSRGIQRNDRTKRWCKEYAGQNGLNYETVRKYQLGFTAALKMRIYRKK